MGKKAPEAYQFWITARLSRLAEQVDYAKDESDLLAVSNELVQLADELEQIMATAPAQDTSSVLYTELVRNATRYEETVDIDGDEQVSIVLHGDVAERMHAAWHECNKWAMGKWRAKP